MEEKLVWRCKGPSGSEMVELTTETSMFDFVQSIAKVLKMDPLEISIKSGFPPKYIQFQDISSTAFSSWVKNKESLIVESDVQNSIYTKAGISNEEKGDTEENKGFEE